MVFTSKASMVPEGGTAVGVRHILDGEHRPEGSLDWFLVDARRSSGFKQASDPAGCFLMRSERLGAL